MKISIVSPNQRASALALLQKASLPVDDIGNNVTLFELKKQEMTIGTIGLENDSRIGLLRSFCVEETQRGKGYGEVLLNFLEEEAAKNGLQALYLLTTTAGGFFAEKGYEAINREAVPEFIQQTKEFSALCPSTAVVMKKDLTPLHAD